MEIDPASSSSTPTHSKYFGLTKKQKKKLQKAGGIENFNKIQEQNKKRKEENIEQQQISKKRKIEDEMTKITVINKEQIIEKNKKLKRKNQKNSLSEKYNPIKGIILIIYGKWNLSCYLTNIKIKIQK